MLTAPQHARALSCILTSAAGDALGAPYEFAPSIRDDDPVSPANVWTDGTAMAIPILEVLSTRLSAPFSPSSLGRLGRRWMEHALLENAGNTVDWVFSAVGDPECYLDAELAVALKGAAEEHYEGRMREGEMPRAGRTGNGSVMRTFPLALLPSHVSGEEVAQAARAVSSSTHADEDANDACVLLTLACRGAILTGEADMRAGLPYLDAERRGLWETRIGAYEGKHPRSVPFNAGCVGALQAAWAAFNYERKAGEGRVKRTLDTAVRSGGDTDTVAALAGALVGAECGCADVMGWNVRGWPGIDSMGLERLVRVVLAEEDAPPSYSASLVDSVA